MPQPAGQRRHEAFGPLAAQVATEGERLAYCARSEWGQREYAHEYDKKLCALGRRFVQTPETTLPMNQTAKDGATGRVQKTQVELESTMLLCWAKKAQHGAPGAMERHAAEKKAELRGALL